MRQLKLSDRSTTEVARDLGIRRNMLHQRQEQLSEQGEEAFRGSGRKPTNQSDELFSAQIILAAVLEKLKSNFSAAFGDNPSL